MSKLKTTPGQTPFLIESASARIQPLIQISCTDRSGASPAEIKAAWSAVLQHFDVLRLGFKSDASGTPTPFIADHPALNWHLIEDPESSSRSADSSNALLAADLSKPFELDQAPLWRITAIAVSPTEVRWVWTVHHALLDGRSFELVLAAFVAAKTHQPLPPVALSATQIATALHHKKQVSSALARAHWQKYFTAPPAPVNPTQPLREVSSPGPTHHQALIALSTAEHTALVRTAQENNVTIGTVIVGVWSLVLSALLDTPDVVFGMTRACRHLTNGEAKNAVGLFINTPPVRAKLDPDQSFSDFLSSLREQQISLRDAELDDTNDIRSVVPDLVSPLYSSIVVIEKQDNTGELNHRWQDSHQLEFNLSRNRPSVPLVLTGHLNPQLDLELIASAKEFDAPFTQSIADTCLHLFRQFVATPHARLGSVKLVPTIEEARIREQLTGPAVAVSEHERLHHRFEKSAQSHPDNVVIHEDETATTYGQLNATAENIADRLRSHGIIPDTLCAIVLPRSARLLASIIGVLKSGGANLMLDADFPLPRLVRLIKQAQPAVVLCDAKFAADLQAHDCAIPCLDPANLPPPSPDDSAPQPPPVLAQHLAYAIFTSGSTGQPKLVGIEHSQAVHFVTHAITHVAEPDALSCVPFIDSPAFDSCISQIFTTLAHAGSLVALSQLADLRDSPFFEKFTCIGSAPNQLTGLLDTSGFPPSARLISTGGDVIPNSLIQALSQRPSVQRVVNLYGPTETTVYCTAQTLFDRQQPTATSTSTKTQLGRNIGHPISNVSVEVVSPLGQNLPAGWPGELWISGALVARGYLLDSAPPNSPFELPPAPRRYHSGDRVVLTPDGSLQFEGRRDRQIKIRGVRIDPAEVASRLREQPEVKDVHIDLHRPPNALPLLAAWIVGTDKLDLKTVRQTVSQQLPAAAVPSLWCALDTLPLTHSGKVDHRSLPVPMPPVDETNLRNLSPTERRLLNIWHNQLNLPAPGLTTDFFATGGDSLVAAQWIAAIEFEFNLRLPVGILNQSASIKDLAQWINRPLADLISPATPTSVSIIPIRKTGKGIPILIIPGGSGEDRQFVRFRPLVEYLAKQRPVYWLSRSLPESIENASDPATISQYVAAATAAITREFGDTPIAILGHCLGGTTTWLINQAFEKHPQAQLKIIMLDSVLPSEFQRRRRFEKRFGLFLAYQSAWQQSYPSALERWLKLPIWAARVLQQKLSNSSTEIFDPFHDDLVDRNPIALALGDNLREQEFEGTTNSPIYILHSNSAARSHLSHEWKKKTSGKITYVHLPLISHKEIVTQAPEQVATNIAHFLAPS